MKWLKKLIKWLLKLLGRRTPPPMAAQDFTVEIEHGETDSNMEPADST